MEGTKSSGKEVGLSGETGRRLVLADEHSAGGKQRFPGALGPRRGFS